MHLIGFYSESARSAFTKISWKIEVLHQLPNPLLITNFPQKQLQTVIDICIYKQVIRKKKYLKKRIL